MSLRDQINQDMKAAMRSKDEARLSAIRMLWAAIQRREVDERITLDDTQVLSVVEKTVRQSRDAVEQFLKGNRPDLADKENRDIAFWEVYLPAQASDEEVAPGSKRAERRRDRAFGFEEGVGWRTGAVARH